MSIRRREQQSTRFWDESTRALVRNTTRDLKIVKFNAIFLEEVWFLILFFPFDSRSKLLRGKYREEGGRLLKRLWLSVLICDVDKFGKITVMWIIRIIQIETFVSFFLKKQAFSFFLWRRLDMFSDNLLRQDEGDLVKKNLSSRRFLDAVQPFYQ